MLNYNIKRKELWIMCGVPGAGKDYWVKNHRKSFEGQVGLISRDEIRFELLKEGEDYFAHEKEVYENFVGRIKSSIQNNDVTIANATHINAGGRGKLLRALGSVLKVNDVEVNAMVIYNNLETCLKQNASREGRALVPESSIRNMYSNFTLPIIDEGFDNIYIYKIEQGCPRYSVIQKGV